ncbi:universal stress protein [Bordetella avium]|uniref:Universal stress protein n=1 Tax=Bordetella avium (strain 197N) TaxID=360910 RepID=Q2KU66_BORA1|nr:universal stress protein [Bordetella avium]AZY53909.1 universal stress protein [Bordetella avium]RIQ55638.1 universal stress protein [Bordetella avium]RIQ73971.1 universal stress protein [Bordetella avium]CAJ50794.1 putative universal stress protein [Bordetella avium 197N]
MTETILLATDLSARSDRALDRALMLARQHHDRLLALHVMEPPSASTLATPAWRRLTPDHKALAEQRLAEDLAEAGVPTEAVVVSGHPLDVILDTVQHFNCSLIVTGVARETTVGRLLLGTTVERLARHASTPVLVVKARPRKPYQDVVIATDFSEGSRQALTAALKLAADARITLFHAYSTPAGQDDLPQDAEVRSLYNDALQKAQAFLAATPELAGRAMPEIVLEAGLPEHMLSEFVFKRRCDLVVTGTHGLTGILRTAIGSVAEKLLEALPCDVLIVRQAAA